MEWVVSTLHTTSEHGVSSITTVNAHTSAASSRLNWCPCWFAERRNLVSVHVPSHLKCSLLLMEISFQFLIVCTSLWVFSSSAKW